MSKFSDFDDWTERDLLCAILYRLREIHHAQVDLPSAILQFEETKARHAEARKADPKRYGPKLIDDDDDSV